MFDCPCGTGKDYLNCCGAYISGEKIPPTPEALMRSRYTAYQQNNLNYIAHTMKSPAADDFNAEEAQRAAKKIEWLKLEIIHTTISDRIGFVEFFAHYISDNKKNLMHEISEFHFKDGRWFYVNGIQPSTKKPDSKKMGRNELCHCGSHKKYKKCCGLK